MVAVHTCPSCHNTGYEAVAEDEVAPCTHPDHVSDMARTFAADSRFAHLGKSPEWWQATLDQEERVKSDSAHLRRSL